MTREKELAIGLDLGGTFLKYALGTKNGELIISRKTPSKAHESMEKIFEVILDSIQELLDEAEKMDTKVIAIGLGSPGAINFETGKQVGTTPNLPKWVDADIRGQIVGRYNIPTWADNDANVMAFAEARQGAAKGAAYMIALTLGTGIGGGILLNNEIYRGYNFAGAEIGHMSVDLNGKPCPCNNVGCIERYASATGIVETYCELKSIPIDGINTEYIFARIKEGEKEAVETLEITAKYLGFALASLANVFNPEVFVIGGGVSDAGDELIDEVWKVLSKHALGPNLIGLKLKRAQLGNEAGMVGAMCLAAEMYEKQQKN